VQHAETPTLMAYDRGKMQRDDNILTFKFGDYQAVEGNHFDARKRQRTQVAVTDIFGETGVSYENAILQCFEILHRDQYKYILETIETNNPKNTEFIIAFETDEKARNENSIYMFFVMAISKKETAFNGIAQGETFVQLMTIVKDRCKIKVATKPDAIEIELGYNKLFDKYVWTDDIKFCPKSNRTKK
jgi:hypothetical protein